MRDYKNRKIHFLSALLLCASLTMSCGQKNSGEDYIGIDAAKESALMAAGIDATNASFSTAGLDKKNDMFYYQVIFTSDGTEYQYAIDAVTGVVIEEKVSEAGIPEQSPANNAADGATAPAQPQANSEPTTAAPSGLTAPDSSAALQTALTHAGLAESDVRSINVESDSDHGRLIYEIEFISSDGVEYEYEIDGADGSIIKFDQDTESSLSLSPNPDSIGIISEAQAREAVLSRVPGADESRLTLRLRENNGRHEYKGQLLHDNMLYEFKIDAYSGAFIEWEAERN